MSFIWGYLKRYPKYLFYDFLGTLIFVAVLLGLPTIFAQVIDNAIVLQDTGLLYRYVLMMLVLVIVGFLGNVLLSYATSYLTTSVVRDIRLDVYKRIQYYSHDEYSQLGIPSMITRITSDAFVIMQFVEMLLRAGLQPVFVILGSIVAIAYAAAELSLIFILSVPLLVFVSYFILKKASPLSERIQVILDRINLFARENLTGLRVIRAFAREDYQEERFNNANVEYEENAQKLNKLLGAMQPLSMHVNMWMIVLTILFALNPIDTGAMQVGTLVAFIEYAFQALFSITIFTQIFLLAPRSFTSAGRLEEMLTINIEIDQNEDGVKETELSGYVKYDNVTFHYPGEETEEPVLRDINFEVNPGKTIAFIGSTGSGKSTVIRLLPRFFDITEGSVLVDGVDVRDYNLSALREKIGFVSQKAVLFTGTIAENLRYGKPDATDAELYAALEVAQATEFVSKMPEGINSDLSEGGSNLSGGQKQRLAIARAIVRDPEVYVFDDSFSALDFKTDRALRAALGKITKEKAVMIVAQRISSITDADEIIVLNEGEIVGRGKHLDLLKTNTIYQAIYRSQIKESEWEVDL